MKIIIVSPAYPWRGGIAHHTSLLALYLSKRHAVEVVTFRRQYPKLLFPGKTQYDVGGKPLAVPTHQWIDSMNPFNWIKVARKISKLQPDLVIFAYSLPFFGLCYGVIAGVLRRKTRATILFVCHNIIPHEKRVGDVALTRYAFAKADCFIVQSTIVEKELLELFPGAKFRLSPHPLYDIFESRLSKEEAREQLGLFSKNVILYFGYIRAYKGLMILIEAMSQIQKSENRIGDTILLVVGEFYDDEVKYRTRVRELDLEKSIRVVSGYIPHDQVADYFSAADAVILPYLSATQSGIAQIAYSLDKPIIATNVGGLAEVVVDQKTGFVVPPNDSQALAEAVVRFYSEGKGPAFSSNVKVEKQKYSWENFVHAVEEIVATK